LGVEPGNPLNMFIMSMQRVPYSWVVSANCKTDYFLILNHKMQHNHPFVIANFKLLKHHLKSKQRAPAYSMVQL